MVGIPWVLIWDPEPSHHSFAGVAVGLLPSDGHSQLCRT